MEGGDKEDYHETESNRAFNKRYFDNLQKLQKTHKQELSKVKSKAERKALMNAQKKEISVLQDARKMEMSRKACDTLNGPSAESTASIHVCATGKDETESSSDRVLTSCTPQQNTRHPMFRELHHSTKAQKRRQKKQQKFDALTEHLEESHGNACCLKSKEDNDLAILLQKHNLRIHPISPDGHCMFRAIAHQLQLRSNDTPWDFRSLRLKTTDYLLEYKDVFKPFFSLDAIEQESDDSSKDSYTKHCLAISQETWGGELELRAMAQILNTCIYVYCAKPPHVLTYASDKENRQDTQKEPLRLSFHLYEYSSGPHYNSLMTVN